MKFVSTRDLRNRPGIVRDLSKEDDLVLTANGKPIALLVGIDEDQVEETSRAVRQARAHLALSRLRREAARQGGNRLALKAIETEIRKARSEHKSR